jgi:hypothetical protein
VGSPTYRARTLALAEQVLSEVIAAVIAQLENGETNTLASVAPLALYLVERAGAARFFAFPRLAQGYRMWCYRALNWASYRRLRVSAGAVGAGPAARAAGWRGRASARALCARLQPERDVNLTPDRLPATVGQPWRPQQRRKLHRRPSAAALGHA